MKVVLITSVYLPHVGGTEIYVYNIAKKLACKNYEVIIIAGDSSIINAKKYIDDNIKVIKLPVFSLYGIINLRNKRFRNIIDKEINNADIVHLNDIKFNCRYLAKKKKEYKYKLYLSSHGFFFHTKKFYFIKKMYMCYIRRYLNEYNKIFCVSENDLFIAKKYKINNSELLFPGVDINKFKNVGLYPSKKNVFVYWGRIAVNKGLYEAIQKMNLLDSDYYFYIIGNCDDKKYIKKINNIIKDKNKILILDNINDNELKKYIKLAEFIIMPSLYEGFGITLIEALSTNKKIIANVNNSFVNILKNCKCEEYLFNFTDKKTNIKDKIEQLRLLQKTPEKLEEYSIDNTIDKILYFYSLK